MNAPSMWLVTAQCLLIAAVFERSTAVLAEILSCSDSAPNRFSTLLQAWLKKIPVLANLNFTTGVTIVGAVCASNSLPLGLLNAIEPGFIDSRLDDIITALFITGVAQLMRCFTSQISALQKQKSLEDVSRLNLNESEPQLISAPTQFKLEGLALEKFAPLQHRQEQK